MSLLDECSKTVSRQHLYRVLSELNEECECANCKYCLKLKIIRAKLYKNGFGLFNKEINFWKIVKNSKSLTVLPVKK